MIMSSNVHQASDLKQMQSLPLEAKIRMSQQRMKIWHESWVRFEIYDKTTGKTRFVTYDARKGEPPLKDTEYIETEFDGQVYISFSDGKDSTVLADLYARLCKEYGWTLYLLFVNTGLEYPEIQKFVKEYAEWLRNTYEIEVVLDIVRPEMRFDEVIKKYGYPAVSKEVAQCVEQAKRNAKTGKYTYRIKRLNNELLDKEGKPSRYNIPQWRFLLDADFDISHQCCNVMKKKPAKAYEKETGRKAIIGTLAQESRLRQQKWIQNGCNAFEGKRPTSQPLSFWTEQDILHYIKKYMQKDFDKAWDAAKNAHGYERRKARKFIKSMNYRRYAYCSVYGDIQIKSESELEGQMNLIDYLDCYEPEDLLETTGCDRTGCIFCMFGCHLEKEPNRFQRLKETHPRQYQYCIGGGEYVYKVFRRHLDGKWSEFDMSWEYDDGTPMTKREIESFAQIHSVGFGGSKEEDMTLKVEKQWQPSKEGLGLGKVLDYIGVKYD